MTGDGWITLAVLAGAFALLVWDRMAPSAVILSATVTLLLTDVLTTTQALSGFSNPAPITVAALYVLARAAQTQISQRGGRGWPDGVGGGAGGR